MRSARIFKVEMRWEPRLWLAVGWMSGDFCIALCGVMVRIGRGF